MNSRIRIRLSFTIITVLVAMTLSALTACNSGTSSEGGGPGLTPGHYFIQSDVDDFYHFDQYFVVQTGNRFEFVEYGFDLDQPGTLCYLVRQKGSYTTDSVTITLTYKDAGENLESCPLTKAQFNAYPFENLPSSQWHVETHAIRNLTSTGLEGESMFYGISGWKNYPLRADPVGFY